ncbi:hypothetical protein AXG93_4280s1070 [Marchantia polymorpha subsp. ruderalis]|uniref:Uncharacterized protein n=1 Tax=Marchantia polymorpha subsp. ruderalis TaxID=1480154 RepID=A0A176WLM2_MARPO|nr:hypothetical protein AXG93_4280s1070 [Marchantia polymorpha subsp. ruderalis]
MPGPRKDCGTRGYQHSLIMVFEWRRVVRLKGVPAAFDEETAGQASISVCCRTSNANGSNAVTHLQVDIDRSFDCSPVHQKRETHLESSPNLNYVTQTSARNGKARAVKHSVQMDMTRKQQRERERLISREARQRWVESEPLASGESSSPCARFDYRSAVFLHDAILIPPPLTRFQRKVFYLSLSLQQQQVSAAVRIDRSTDRKDELELERQEEEKGGGGERERDEKTRQERFVQPGR